jgi:hypothetical protein
MRYVEEWDNGIPIRLTAILDPVDSQGTFYPEVGVAIAEELLPLILDDDGITYQEKLRGTEDVESTKTAFLEQAYKLQEQLSNLISEYNRFARFQKISEKLAKQT